MLDFQSHVLKTACKGGEALSQITIVLDANTSTIHELNKCNFFHVIVYVDLSAIGNSHQSKHLSKAPNARTGVTIISLTTNFRMLTTSLIPPKRRLLSKFFKSVLDNRLHFEETVHHSHSLCLPVTLDVFY